MDYEKLHYYETLCKLQEMVSKGKITEEVARGICADFVTESEDEKIRKEMIFYFTEEIPQCSIQEHADKIKIFIAWLEKQDEQKPADKVEPKFKVGDWVVFNNKHQSIYQVEKIEDGYYILRHTHGGTFRVCVLHDESLRLWTIQDAKVGDVLYLQKDGKEHIIIYKGVIKERFRTFVSAYCAYNGIVDAFCFADVSRYVDIAYRGIMPATKEQRDLLFQEMKEAGYEWNAEKKELRKIEQKPVDATPTNEDKVRKKVKEIFDSCEKIDVSEMEKNRAAFGLLELEAFADIFYKIGKEQKQTEWSEEDEKMIEELLNYCDTSIQYNGIESPQAIKWKKRKGWLKFLKDRYTWKPSDEKMEAVRIAAEIGTANNSWAMGVLNSLYQDLKKLREE